MTNSLAFNVDKDIAITLAQSLIARHNLEEYKEAVKKLMLENETTEQIHHRALCVFNNTNFEGADLIFQSVAFQDEDYADYWKVGILIACGPISNKDMDGIHTPAEMKVSKHTGKISNLWAELTF